MNKTPRPVTTLLILVLLQCGFAYAGPAEFAWSQFLRGPGSVLAAHRAESAGAGVAGLRNTPLFTSAHSEPRRELPANLPQKVEEVVSKWLELRGAPGVVVGIVQGDELVYAKGFGVADITFPARRLDPESLFHVASNSKPFVAAALLRLAEQGKIDLGAPVVRYLAYFELADPRYKQITVRQMMNHTSGMPDEEEFSWGDSVELDDGALERYVRSLKDKSLVAAPGSTFHYSNMGYEVLGDLISKTSGETFEAYMKEDVLAPLGMRNSTFLLAEVSRDHLTTPHTRRLRTEVSDIRPYTRIHAPSSTLYASVKDLANWAQMILNGGIFDGQAFLSPSSYQQFVTPTVETHWSGYDNQAALPWAVGTYRGHTIISHKGRDLGYGSMLALIPDRRLAVIVLGNSHFAPIAQITEATLDLCLGFEPAPPKVSVEYPIGKVLAEKGVDTAVEAYRGMEKKPSGDYVFSEDALRSLGRTLIRLGRLADAIRIFEFNLEQYPGSTRTLDSLGEAFVRLGDFKRGQQTYQKSLELNPDDEEAAEMLRRLRGMTAKP